MHNHCSGIEAKPQSELAKWYQWNNFYKAGSLADKYLLPTPKIVKQLFCPYKFKLKKEKNLN